MHIQITRQIARKLRRHRALSRLIKREPPPGKDPGTQAAISPDKEDKPQ